MDPIRGPIAMPGARALTSNCCAQWAGIDSAAPGFHRVRIAPNLGSLGDLTAQAPSPAGLDSGKDCSANESHLKADVELPPGISGEFVLARLDTGTEGR